MPAKDSTTAAVPETPPPGPCTVVVFGATGDLTKRLLMPALCNLAQSHLLPANFAVVGVASQTMDSGTFADRLAQDIRETATIELEPKLWDSTFAHRMSYVAGDFAAPATYQQLKRELSAIDQAHQTAGNYLFYLAVPPRFFNTIIQQLAAAGLTNELEASNAQAVWRRVIVEKPFGHNLESARELNRNIQSVLAERQIYRIDHYLGKETVQNILVLRFANGIFEPIWNRQYIDHVQITVAETVGVEHRGPYYDHAGALRDMVPNHIFQLLALIAMESPGSFAADAVRDEKAKLLRAIRPMTQAEVLTDAVRGQYGPGSVSGQHVVGYRQSPGVAEDSKTETFAAFKLSVDNWRWADVPFYLRTGKCLPRRVSEVVVQFKQAPFLPFRETSVEHLKANRLILRLQPDEGIALRFEAKRPGIAVRTNSVHMDFSYAEQFGPTPFVGYEALLYDCMLGDPTLFQRSDFVEAGWQAVAPMLDVWETLPARNFPNYVAGSSGPEAADQLLERDGRSWQLD